MGDWGCGLLTAQQAEYVGTRLNRPEVIADLSWGQADTKVLKVQADDSLFIVKAAGSDNHHIAREITAHRRYTDRLVAEGRAGRMRHSSSTLNLLILEYLEGQLVEGTPAEAAADTHHQAGKLLCIFHGQESRFDGTYESRATAKALGWLERKHRIGHAVEREIRARFSEYRPTSVKVVPTHGDWQPRNWLAHQGAVKIIDFGRFDFRPPASDFCRLAVQQWQRDPALESAFFAGYGDDPRSAPAWRMELLREAVGTAVWAHVVGDDAFEAQGHRMVSQALSRF